MPRTRTALQAEAVYRQAVTAIVVEIGRLVARGAATLDEEQLAAAIGAYVPVAARLVAAGQQQAQAAAADFLSAFLSAETGRDVRPVAIARETAGRNTEGAGIERLIAGGLVRSIFGALRNGSAPVDALASAARGIASFAHGEIAAAADSELIRQASRRREVAGWIWIPVGLTCAACLSYGSGEVRPMDQRPPRHSRCNCIVSIQMTDDPETVRRPTGEQLFRMMTPAQQAASFRTAGAEKAELVRSGRVTLAELTAVERHDGWRDTIVERPLSEIA